MKVLVCGGREYMDDLRVQNVLSKLVITCIVEGGAPGADTLARLYGQACGIEVKEYAADWDTHGRAAGPIRNKQMLDENPDVELVVAFPGGRGTANMIKQAKERGVSVLEVAK